MPIYNNALTNQPVNRLAYPVDSNLGAAFGYYPQMRRNRIVQDPQAAADMPVQFARGRVAGTLGLPSDILNILRTPLPMEAYGDVDYGAQTQVPYGSQELLKTLPLPPEGAAQEAAANIGAVIPLSPAEALKAARAATNAAMAAGKAGVKTLGPTAARMTEEYLVKTGGILPMDVYHGSPYKFDKFDSAKIGTGEGAQAYGHGLYLAESPDVAKGYQSTLGHKGALDLQYEAGQRGIPLSREAQIEFMRQSMRDTLPKVTVKNLQNANIEARSLDADKLAGLVKDYKESKQGQFYKVDLPDNQIAKMLDYDNAVPESVRKPLSQVALNEFGSGLTGTSGEKLYKDVIFSFKQAGHPNPTQAATDWLTKQGVPGMRYLDSGSRGTGAGSSNFVVFPGNEGMLNILERNGQKAMPVNNLAPK